MAQNTFFAEIHQELDAKMIPGGKWNLPLFYPGGSVAEHRHTRSEASIFDLTGRRCFQLTGRSCGAELDKIFMYPCGSLPVGKVMDNILLGEHGRFTALFTLCRMQEDDFMLLLDRNIPEAAAAEMLAVLKNFSPRELSDSFAQLAVIGRKADEVLLSAGAVELPGGESWKMLTLHDEDGDELRCIAIRNDRFGEKGYDLLCNAALALEVYGAIYRINGTAPAGVGAWESLRIESGTPAPGSELTGDLFPVESGWQLPEDISRDFRGKTALLAASCRYRTGMIELERHPALPGSPVSTADGLTVGVVSSGAFCPGIGVAAVLVRVEANIPEDAELFCQVNGKSVPGVFSPVKEQTQKSLHDK